VPRGYILSSLVYIALNIANRQGLQRIFPWRRYGAFSRPSIRIYHGSGLSAYGGNPLQAIQVTFVTIPMDPEAIAREKHQLSRPAHRVGRVTVCCVPSLGLTVSTWGRKRSILPKLYGRTVGSGHDDCEL
jgi:hypothetical protein